MKLRLILGLFCSLFATSVLATQAATVEKLFDTFVEQGAKTPFDAQAGKNLWAKKVGGKSCAGCHTEDPTQQGKNPKTGKKIQPMATSAYAKRFTKYNKAVKSFAKHCKRVFGAECSAQEKADILEFLTRAE